MQLPMKDMKVVPMAVEEEMDDYADIDFIDGEEEEELEEEAEEEAEEEVEEEAEEEEEEEEEEIALDTSEEMDAEVDEIDDSSELETMEELDMSSTGSTDVKANQDKAPAVRIISNRLTRIMAKEGIKGAKLIHFSNEVLTFVHHFLPLISWLTSC